MLGNFNNKFFFNRWLFFIIFIDFSQTCKCVGFVKSDIVGTTVSTVLGNLIVMHENNIPNIHIKNVVNDLIYDSVSKPWLHKWQLVKYYHYDSNSGVISHFMKKSPLSHPNALLCIIDNIAFNLPHTHHNVQNFIKISNIDCYGEFRNQWVSKYLHLYDINNKLQLILNRETNIYNSNRIQNNFLMEQWKSHKRYHENCKNFVKLHSVDWNLIWKKSLK